MSSARHLARGTAVASLFLLAGVGSAVHAAVPPSHDNDRARDARAQYARDRANCLSGHTTEGLKTCLREAGAREQAAREHDLTSPSPREMAANERRRCDPLPGDDKQACLARVQGHGTESGSVAGGGILYEYHEVVPGTPPGTTPLPANSSQGTGH